MATDAAYDAIVIGGGPAGSTAGGLLAEMGHRALILEKERFPRYCVGESLLPYCYFTLERLGLIEQMKASRFTKKYSVQFVGIRGRASQPFYFDQHLGHEASMTWQVVRSEFDRMLLDNARAKGAEVREEMTVREEILADGAVVGVCAVDSDGRDHAFRAPVTIDASGRDAFCMTRRGWRVNEPDLNKIAIWTYYRGARRDPGIDEGATTVAYLPEKGWLWYIPLPDDVVGVGVVADREYLYRGPRDPDTIFAREIEVNGWIREHLASGEKIEPCRVTGDYSYRTKHGSADGVVLVGDAFSFLDPVFSSGVFLALKSGEMAADAVDEGLRAGDVSARRFTAYSEQLCRGIEAMRKLVYAFYDRTFSFGALLKEHEHVRGDLTDCLIGHLFRDFDPLFSAVARFARLPAPLAHGGPVGTS